MLLIPDDPIVRSIERTGYPPWIDAEFYEIDDEEDLDEEADEEADGADAV